jgi:hypothetical protein
MEGKMKTLMLGMLLMAMTPASAAILAPVVNVPVNSWHDRVSWRNVPDMTFECEDNSKLIVSHQRNILMINDKVVVAGELRSDVMYAPIMVHDKFGNDRVNVFIDVHDIKGPASTLTDGLPWELANGSGAPDEAPFLSTGVWFFYKGSNWTKCLPTENGG